MRWWEILVPVFVLVVGLNSLPASLGNGIYALLGVLICTVAAWLSVVLVRRCKIREFFKRLGSQP